MDPTHTLAICDHLRRFRSNLIVRLRTGSGSTASHRDDGVDITVGCPACDSYVCDAAVTSADHVTDRLELGKNSKHAAACDAVGLRFVAAAFTTLGGWGRTARKQLHTLYAKKKKAEKRAGGTGWDTIRWKQDLLAGSHMVP